MRTRKSEGVGSRPVKIICKLVVSFRRWLAAFREPNSNVLHLYCMVYNYPFIHHTYIISDYSLSSLLCLSCGLVRDIPNAEKSIFTDKDSERTLHPVSMRSQKKFGGDGKHWRLCLASSASRRVRTSGI